MSHDSEFEKQYRHDGVRLTIASVLLVVVVITPVFIGYQLDMLMWGIVYSFTILIAVALLYESGKFHGSHPLAERTKPCWYP